MSAIPLPKSVGEIAAVLGRHTALFLIGQLPRCFVRDTRWPGAASNRVIMYVPKTLRPDHPLVQILGWMDAKKLVSEFGGEILTPAPCTDLVRQFKQRSIRTLAAEGLDIQEIADTLQLSPRTVQNTLRENPQEEKPLKRQDGRRSKRKLAEAAR